MATARCAIDRRLVTTIGLSAMLCSTRCWSTTLLLAATALEAGPVEQQLTANHGGMPQGRTLAPLALTRATVHSALRPAGEVQTVQDGESAG